MEDTFYALGFQSVLRNDKKKFQREILFNIAVRFGVKEEKTWICFMVIVFLNF